jgi:hypothetical protein
MKKIICVFLSMLFIISAPNIISQVNSDKSTKNTDTANFDDDVPVWEVGDSWTYTLNPLSFELNQSGSFVSLNISMTDLFVDVVEATDDSYTLKISGSITGSFNFDDGAGTQIAGVFLLTRIISGSIQLRKADIALLEAHIIIRGIALLIEHPFPINMRIPIPLTLTVNVLQNAPRPLIDFPLFDGKENILNESSVSVDFKLESIVLRILNIFFPDIPAEIFFEQTVNTPMLAYSAIIENVTVPAGTFSAYNILFFEGMLGDLYYAPTAGSIVKAEAGLDMEDQFNAYFKCELKSYNYS